MEIMFANELIEPPTTAVHRILHLVVYNKFEFFRLRKVRSGRVDASGSKIDFASSERSEDEFVHTECGRSIHAGVFAKESRNTIIVHDN